MKLDSYSKQLHTFKTSSKQLVECCVLIKSDLPPIKNTSAQCARVRAYRCSTL